MKKLFTLIAFTLLSVLKPFGDKSITWIPISLGSIQKQIVSVDSLTDTGLFVCTSIH